MSFQLIRRRRNYFLISTHPVLAFSLKVTTVSRNYIAIIALHCIALDWCNSGELTHVKQHSCYVLCISWVPKSQRTTLVWDEISNFWTKLLYIYDPTKVHFVWHNKGSIVFCETLTREIFWAADTHWQSGVLIKTWESWDSFQTDQNMSLRHNTI